MLLNLELLAAWFAFGCGIVVRLLNCSLSQTTILASSCGKRDDYKPLRKT